MAGIEEITDRERTRDRCNARNRGQKNPANVCLKAEQKLPPTEREEKNGGKEKLPRCNDERIHFHKQREIINREVEHNPAVQMMHHKEKREMGDHDSTESDLDLPNGDFHCIPGPV
jgi:hypothetical protein